MNCRTGPTTKIETKNFVKNMKACRTGPQSVMASLDFKQVTQNLNINRNHTFYQIILTVGTMWQYNDIIYKWITVYEKDEHGKKVKYDAYPVPDRKVVDGKEIIRRKTRKCYFRYSKAQYIK